MQLPNLEFKTQLINTMVANECEPWLGRTDWIKLAELLDESTDKLRGQYRRLIEWLEDNNHTIEAFVAFSSDKLSPLVDTPTSPQTTLTDNTQPHNDAISYLQRLGYDPEQYIAVPKSVWQGANGQLQTSYRIELKGSGSKPITNFVTQLASYNTLPVRNGVITQTKPDAMAVFSLYDPHFGKLTLSDDKDIVTAYKETLITLAESVATREGSLRAVLVVGQDYANFDTTMGTTTAGTPQSNNMGWRELITTQIGAATWAIDYLFEKFGNVEVVLVPGNHSVMNDYWLYQYLHMLYPNLVIRGGDDWFAIRHGDVGIMFIHGNEGKMRDYIDLWATISPETWAFSKYREVHTGHLHTRKEIISESHGVIQRYMPGLCGTDEWHKGKLYIGNNRMGLVTVYNKQRPTAEYYAYIV